MCTGAWLQQMSDSLEICAGAWLQQMSQLVMLGHHCQRGVDQHTAVQPWDGSLTHLYGRRVSWEPNWGVGSCWATETATSICSLLSSTL